MHFVLVIAIDQPAASVVPPPLAVLYSAHPHLALQPRSLEPTLLPLESPLNHWLSFLLYVVRAVDFYLASLQLVAGTLRSHFLTFPCHPPRIDESAFHLDKLIQSIDEYPRTVPEHRINKQCLAVASAMPQPNENFPIP